MSSSSEADAVANLDPRRPTAHLTIEEVGRLAGVSRNTVSLALANSPRVRPETRQRVLEVVRATGYQRNSAAAALAGGSTRTLGVVEFGPPAYLSDRVYLGYLAGIEEATSASGYDLLLLSARRPADPRGLLTLARARRFDGLVLLGQETDRQVVAE
ncbi:MAG TPA: LacI family DNA-binding transcriptional regulator, partial [Chloroflexota bacterium]